MLFWALLRPFTKLDLATHMLIVFSYSTFHYQSKSWLFTPVFVTNTLSSITIFCGYKIFCCWWLIDMISAICHWYDICHLSVMISATCHRYICHLSQLWHLPSVTDTISVIVMISVIDISTICHSYDICHLSHISYLPSVRDIVSAICHRYDVCNRYICHLSQMISSICHKYDICHLS